MIQCQFPMNDRQSEFCLLTRRPWSLVYFFLRSLKKSEMNLAKDLRIQFESERPPLFERGFEVFEMTEVPLAWIESRER